MAHNARAKRIQMDVSYQLEEVSLGIAGDRRVAILEERPSLPVAVIEGSGKAGEKRLHRTLDRDLAPSDEEMEVVGHQRPGVNHHSAVVAELREASQQIFAIPIVEKDRSPMASPRHHVLHANQAG